MKKIIVLIIAVMPGLALAGLDWPPYRSEDAKQACVKGFGSFAENQYCMMLQCEGKDSENVIRTKLAFVSEGYEVSQKTYYSNGECYFQYSR